MYRTRMNALMTRTVSPQGWGSQGDIIAHSMTIRLPSQKQFRHRISECKRGAVKQYTVFRTMISRLGQASAITSKGHLPWDGFKLALYSHMHDESKKDKYQYYTVKRTMPSATKYFKKVFNRWELEERTSKWPTAETRSTNPDRGPRKNSEGLW